MDLQEIGLHKFLQGLVHAFRDIAWHLGQVEPARDPQAFSPMEPWGLGLGQNPN
jgi:hypothetical protein